LHVTRISELYQKYGGRLLRLLSGILPARRILSLFGDLWIEKYAHPVQHGRGERGFRSNINGEWVAGPDALSELETNRRDWRVDTRAAKLASDRFWTSRLFSKITAPLLSAANWGGQGLHFRGNIEGFLQARSIQKWLDFHCFEHWTEFYTKTGIALQKRFFGYFLNGEDNGWNEQPRVMMQVRHPEKPLGSMSAPSWPLPDTEWRKLYLDPAAQMLTTGTAVCRRAHIALQFCFRRRHFSRGSARTGNSLNRSIRAESACLHVNG
jgi:predicted acyl esterase